MTANEDLQDALLRHQIGLLNFSGHLRNEVIALLNATEPAVRDRILRASLTPGGTAALLRALERIRDGNGSKGWIAALAAWRANSGLLLMKEPETINGIVRASSPVRLDTALPKATVLRPIITQGLFPRGITERDVSRTLKDWMSRHRQADIDRIHRAVRTGVSEGQDQRTIAKAIVGTVRRNGRDGVTQIARTDADKLTRLMVSHVTSESREAYYRENDDVLPKKIFVATLDSRTTPICRSLDGTVYKVDEGPKFPLHWGERSLYAPFFEKDIATRPAVPVTERILVREFTDEAGISGVTTRARLPRGTKRDFDAFKAKRVRELVGPVPSGTDYQTFLSRQSAEFQDEVLGKTKGALFRRGGLNVDKFVDPVTFEERTLSDLARRQPQAFKMAGLEPAEFL